MDYSVEDIIPDNFFRDDLDNREVMVSIHCTTYNHENYIREALEGFVMQKTNFRFEAIVHDDASTDNTASIIREYAEKYPSIIKPIFEKENQYSKRDGSIERIMDAHMRGKYIAYCEGDDYWTDFLKLQKQIDYLNLHPEVGLVHTRFSFLKQYTLELQEYFLSDIEEEEEKILAIIDNHRYRIQTCTVVCRKFVVENVKSADSFLFQGSHFLMGDTPLWVSIGAYTKISYIDENTAVYRIIDNSACRQKDALKNIEFCLNCMECRYYLSKKYNLKIPLRIKLQFNYYWIAAKLFDSKRDILYRPFLIVKHFTTIIKKLRLQNPIKNLLIKRLYAK